MGVERRLALVLLGHRVHALAVLVDRVSEIHV